MPRPKKNESRDDYIRRCYKQVRAEGLDHKAALGKCAGMWRTYGGGKPKKGDRTK